MNAHKKGSNKLCRYCRYFLFFLATWVVACGASDDDSFSTTLPYGQDYNVSGEVYHNGSASTFPVQARSSFLAQFSSHGVSYDFSGSGRGLDNDIVVNFFFPLEEAQLRSLMAQLQELNVVIGHVWLNSEYYGDANFVVQRFFLSRSADNTIEVQVYDGGERVLLLEGEVEFRCLDHRGAAELDLRDVEDVGDEYVSDADTYAGGADRGISASECEEHFNRILNR